MARPGSCTWNCSESDELIVASRRSAGKWHSSGSRQYPVPRLFQIINFDTFVGEADIPNHLSMVRMAMPHNWPDSSVPEPVKDQKPADDFFASRLADRIRVDAWRKKLTMIRGEILEIIEQGSQQGLVDLKRETVELARTLERLEASLGLSNK